MNPLTAKRRLRLVTTAIVAISLGAWLFSAIGCGSSSDPAAPGDGTNVPPSGTNCSTPQDGCACQDEGQVVDCGKVETKIDSYVECSMGKRTCTAGHWSTCQGDLIVTKSITPGLLHTNNLGSSAACVANPCDPYCNAFVDDPVGITLPAGFGFADGGGLALSAEAGAGGTCTSITIAPATTTITVTSLTSQPPPVPFTATYAPAGCAPPSTQPTWTLNRPDLAVIDASGNLTLFGAVAGNNLFTVQAFFGALASNIANVSVRVNVIAAVGAEVTPNVAAAPGQVNQFYTSPARTAAATPTVPSDVTWLYPYADTYFPRGLPAPVVQYLMSANAGNTVKVTLRFPSGSTAATSLFEYALFATESSVVYPTAPASAKDPQVVVPQTAWRGFEETAKGADADLIIQRLAAGAVQNENQRRIHFVDAVLKGTVYYNSYSSPLGGNTGAVLKIAPGATSPTLAVQPSGSCTVCHTLNVDGTRLIAKYGVTGSFDTGKLYDLTTYTGPASPAVLQSYNGGQGNQFTLGAPYVDGHLYMTHGGAIDQEWHSSTSPSMLYDPMAPATAKTVSGWPNNVMATTPRFSPTGSRLGFTFGAGSGLAQSPSGTLNSDGTLRTLAVVDFTCGAGCTSGFAVSNARNVTPGVPEMVAWPTFAPDGNSVVYQRQYQSSRTRISGWDPSDIDSVGGALAELWISDVPANASTPATPTRMKALNGLTPGGTSYLPQAARTLAPVPTAYHADNSTYGIRESDNCSNTGTAIGVSDYRLNYYPSFMPRVIGNTTWMVFSSRRMYGNIAYDNPWDPEPTYACSSQKPPTKKIWVAAVDSTWTPGTDPSHPAFYLPGQELAGGNSNAYWVDSPCGTSGASCDGDGDCCQAPTAQSCRIDVGTGPPVTRSCRALSACSSLGSTCTVDADCCGSPSVKCLGSVCASETSYAPATFTRQYVAACPPGSRPIWEAFEWQAIIVPGTSIDFKAQTEETTAGPYGAPVSIGSAIGTTATWTTGPQTVDQALRTATPPQVPGTVLLISMTFQTSGLASPILTNWRQTYDCQPNE